MQVDVDAVVGDAVLRKVVGPDLVRSIAQSDHAASHLCFGLVLPYALHLQQTRPQHGKCFGLVLVLALFILNLDDQAGGRWVIRTAESVVLTYWPPGPDERLTSMRKSLSSSIG